MRMLLWTLALSFVWWTASAKAEGVLGRTALALELGGSPTFLFSDVPTQVFGLGMGYHGSLSFVTKTEDPWGYKVRVERYHSRQESLSPSNIEDFGVNTRIKALSQQYTLLGVGAEWRSQGSGHQVFYEALVGYALGVHGKAEYIDVYSESEIMSRDVTLVSRPFVAGGIGIKRKWTEMFFLIASARTFFIFGSPYGGELENRTLIPLPLQFSVGTEYRF